MDRITIYPDENLLEKINQEAEEDLRSVNNLVIKILKEHFEDKKEVK